MDVAGSGMDAARGGTATAQGREGGGMARAQGRQGGGTEMAWRWHGSGRAVAWRRKWHSGMATAQGRQGGGLEVARTWRRAGGAKGQEIGRKRSGSQDARPAQGLRGRAVRRATLEEWTEDFVHSTPKQPFECMHSHDAPDMP